MKKTRLSLTVIIFLLAGCNLPANSTPTPAPVQPVTIIEQTAVVQPTVEIVPVPTETSTPSPAVTLPPPALPVCSAEMSITGCEIPTARELDRFCAQDKPYTLYAFPPGTTVEAVTPEFMCNDEGIRKGKQQYSCTGLPSYTFRARVCNTACTAPVNQESEQCPRGYGVNTLNNCCVPVQNSVNGCVEINLQVGQCGG
jgi:hypothetical protein